MRLVYNVYDDDNQIESKQFDNFPNALEYAKQGLITYICEEDLDCPDCEELVVWTWDSSWNDEEAIANVTKKECAPDKVECEEPFSDDNIEITISGPSKEVKSLVELVFDDAFDLDWDAPVEDVKVDAPKCADEFGLDEEPAIKDLDFDVDSPFEDDLYYSKEEDEEEKDLEIGEPEIIETPEEESNGEEVAEDETEANDEEPKSKDKDNKEDDQEELDELLDLNVSASIDGGDNNNVRVLSSCKRKMGNKKLAELLDANINLGFSGGTGNDVSVLSPLGEEAEDGEKVELTEGTGFFSLFDDAAEKLFLEKWSDILNEHLKNRINLVRMRVKRNSGRTNIYDNDHLTNFRFWGSEVWTYGTEPKLIFKLSSTNLDEKNLRVTPPSNPIDINILLDDLATVDKATGAVRPKSRIAADKNYDLDCKWDYTSIEFTKWTSQDFRNLLTKLVEEQKELKQSTDGRKTKVRAEKRLAQFNQEEIEIAKKWFKDHIEKIEFNVVSGSPRGISTDDFDIERAQVHKINNVHIKNIDDAIDDAILERQEKFLSDYNITHIKPSLSNAGTNIKIGTNIYLNWRRADEDVQKHLPYYITDFFNTCKIYFDTQIGNAPKEVVNILTDAVYGSDRTTRNLDSSKRVLQNSLAGEMIINQLFGSDLDFLSNRLAASFNRKSKNVIIKENLQEGLNNAEREEYFKLCKEIGIYGSKDLEAFMNEVGLKAGCPAQDVLQALRDYRAELGPDFKIVNESNKEELNELFGFGKKSKPKHRYLMAMFLDTSRRMYTSDVWRDILQIVEKYVDTTRSRRSYFAADILNQVEFVATEDVFKRVESEVKNFLSGLHWKRKKYFTGSSDWVSGDGEVNFDIAAAAKHLIGFARVESNIKESVSEEVKLATNKKGDYLVAAESGKGYTVFSRDNVHIGGFDGEDDQKAIDRFNKGDFKEAIKMTKDELLDKEGTTDVDLINAGRSEKDRVELSESNDYYQPNRELGGYVVVDADPFMYGKYWGENWEKKALDKMDRDDGGLDEEFYIDIMTDDLDEAEVYGSVEDALSAIEETIDMPGTCLIKREGKKSIKIDWTGTGEHFFTYEVKKLYHYTHSWSELEEQLTEGRQPIYSNVIFYCYDQNDEEQTYTKSNMTPIMIRTEVDELVKNGAARVYVEAKIDGEWEALDKYTYDPVWTPGTPEYAARNGKDFALALESLDQEDDLTDQEFAEQLQKKLQESQSQEISREYDRLSKKYGINFEDLVYGEEGFMKTKYPDNFPDFAGDVIYSEKYWNELVKFAKEKGIELN